MNVLFLSSEVAPFAKTGGLGDVAAALPRALHRRGHDVRVFMPFYSRIEQNKYRFRSIDSLRGMRVIFGTRSFEVSIFAAQLPHSMMEVFFVHCPQLYSRHAIYAHDGDEHLRFLVLCYAALEAAQRMRFAPDVVHCNDWQTAMVPLLLKTRFAWDGAIFGRARSVLTIHNLNYQGAFPTRVLPETGLLRDSHLLHQDQLKEGRINFLLHGILYANAVTTVSPTYAKEIRTPEFGANMDGFLRARESSVFGILNGVDYDEWSPQADKHIPQRYGPDWLEGKELCKGELLSRARLPSLPGVPLLGIVSRLASQKGFELLPDALGLALREGKFQLVVQGSGEKRFERMFHDLRRRFPRQVRFQTQFDNALAHWIQAGSDFFLMPSKYEPCGLTQLYALKYGTVPIVRKTGGLADTVQLWSPRTGTGTGIVFDDFNAQAVHWALEAAFNIYRDRPEYRQLQRNGMLQDFSWDRSVKSYEALYARLR
ncbi:MAG: glycogen synthase [Archangium sp.]|nr:glycogen synthase [Archangium sp.]